MRASRVNYSILIIATIVVGLLSRHFKTIPLFIGDILWATMIYFMTRFLFINKPLKLAIAISILFCFAIEFSQLYREPWINELRHTLFGRLVLGEGFLWSDLLCYVAGIGMGVAIDQVVNKKLFST
jgi:predicted neutral ceramidase superfamily lipid hydrolase